MAWEKSFVEQRCNPHTDRPLRKASASESKSPLTIARFNREHFGVRIVFFIAGNGPLWVTDYKIGTGGLGT
jgi:hypothetical protein